jgi:hypothetical protein
MDFEINLIEGGKIGAVAFNISLTKTLFLKILLEIFKFKEDHHIDLLIYDLRRFPLDISAFEQYDFIYNLSNLHDDYPCRKIALWVEKGDHSYDFIETLYLNTGRSARLFEDYDKAVRWLTAEKN